jgi:hypothetical protein
VDSDGPLPGSRALIFGEPGQLFELRAPVGIAQDLRFFPFERDRDAVVLELVAPDRAGTAAIPIGSPTEWASLVIPGFVADEQSLSTALKSGSAGLTKSIVDSTSVVDTSPLCIVVFPTTSTKPYLFHACQSRYGFSGAPIFARQADGTHHLIGVHTGSVDKQNPVDKWPYWMLFPNYGLRLPEVAKTLIR